MTGSFFLFCYENLLDIHQKIKGNQTQRHGGFILPVTRFGPRQDRQNKTVFPLITTRGHLYSFFQSPRGFFFHLDGAIIRETGIFLPQVVPLTFDLTSLILQRIQIN